jgi:hypothetical protein
MQYRKTTSASNKGSDLKPIGDTGWHPFRVRIGRLRTAPVIASAALGALITIGVGMPTPAAAQVHTATVNSRRQTENRFRDVVERPASWMGRMVTVEGQVSHIYGPHMFTIHGPGDLANSEIPVVGSEPISIQYDRPGSPTLRVNDRVRITGTALYFTRDTVQDMLDARLPNDVYRRFTDRLMIVTNFVGTDDLTGASAPRYHARGGVADITYMVTRPRLEDMIGQWARLSNVKVLSLVSDRGFWVGERDNRRLFAVLDPALDRGEMDRLVRVKPGQTLNLIGVIEKMPSRQEAMRRWTTIDNKEADALSREPAYLHVRSISILNP